MNSRSVGGARRRPSRGPTRRKLRQLGLLGLLGRLWTAGGRNNSGSERWRAPKMQVLCRWAGGAEQRRRDAPLLQVLLPWVHCLSTGGLNETTTWPHHSLPPLQGCALRVARHKRARCFSVWRLAARRPHQTWMGALQSAYCAKAVCTISRPVSSCRQAFVGMHSVRSATCLLRCRRRRCLCEAQNCSICCLKSRLRCLQACRKAVDCASRASCSPSGLVLAPTA